MADLNWIDANDDDDAGDDDTKQKWKTVNRIEWKTGEGTYHICCEHNPHD